MSDPNEHRSPIVFVAEVIGALTAFAFLTSALIQSLVFGLWGISYFQVASADDVVMGGLAYLFAATPLWVLFFGGLFGRRIYRLVTRTAAHRAWLGATVPAEIFGAAGTALVGIVFLSLPVAPEDWRQSHVAMLKHFTPFAFVLGLLFEGPYPRGTGEALVRGSINVLLVFLLLIGMQPYAERYAAFGYLRDLRPTADLEGCLNSRVMWIGSQHRIYRCDSRAPNPNQVHYVVTEADGQVSWVTGPRFRVLREDK